MHAKTSYGFAVCMALAAMGAAQAADTITVAE